MPVNTTLTRALVVGAVCAVVDIDKLVEELRTGVEGLNDLIEAVSEEEFVLKIQGEWIFSVYCSIFYMNGKNFCHFSKFLSPWSDFFVVKCNENNEYNLLTSISSDGALAYSK